MEKRKFVQIPVNGPIAELGFITGPVGPTYVNLPSVIKMVQNGKLVYEVDPANHAHKVKLDITNVKKNNIAQPVKFEKPPATDSEPTPVVAKEVKESEKTPEPEKVETVEETAQPEEVAEVTEETKADDVVNKEVTAPEEEKKDENKEPANNNIVKQYNAQKQNNYKNKKKK